MVSGLESFVAESNRIEGIHAVAPWEIQAHETLFGKDELYVRDLEVFVWTVAPGKFLRRDVGMNVMVGDHVAPAGGPEIYRALSRIVDKANQCGDPHKIHVRYEILHPFMDGNGRSGRALWAWQMLKYGDDALALGFLHRFYYQTLAAAR